VPKKRLALEIAALSVLALGVLVYLVDRLPESVYLLPVDWSLASGRERWFGAIGGQLPEFVHVYAFALLTAAVFAGSRKRAFLICTAWWVTDSLFELGQHPAISPSIAAAMPHWVKGVPLLENIGPYFAYGTFDPLDLAAITVGAVAAYFTVVFYIREEDWRYVECS
jgi:hypothetical protein